MASLILVRHGETAFNAAGRFQGRIDPPLGPRGVRQAQELRSLLARASAMRRGRRVHLEVFASPAARALETARLALPELAPTVDTRLAELDFGDFDGNTWEQNLEAHGERFTAWTRDPERVAPPNGETLRALEARVVAWLDALEAGTDVVAFTHGGPIYAALAHLLGLPFQAVRRFRVRPGDALRLPRGASPRGLHWPVSLRSARRLARGEGPQRLHVEGLERWLASCIARVAPADRADPAAVQAHLDRLTKPSGSLGGLETLAMRLAKMCGDPPPPLRRRTVLVLAADHGVAARGVSAYPREVTAQMCRNYAAGGAAINAIARAVSAHVAAVDVGVDAEPGSLGLPSVAVRRGTSDLADGPAMTRAQALRAMRAGAALVEQRLADTDVFALGEMGIGSSTASAALTAALCAAPADAVVGAGTGVDAAGLARKREVVRRAVARIPPDADPVGVLAEVGGLEIAALAGAVLAAAGARRPVVTDGFIATAAVLVAARLAPAAADYVIASHRSVEPGHALQLAALGLEPLLDLRLRLGEGTGAALALPIVDAAGSILRDMATFEGAGVATATVAGSAPSDTTATPEAPAPRSAAESRLVEHPGGGADALAPAPLGPDPHASSAS